MTSEKNPARPSQVTMAGVIAMGAGVALVFSVFSRMAQLRTVDGREAIQEYLATGPGKGLGLGFEQALGIARAGLFVTAALAAVTVVASFFALRRDKPSRVVLAVIAVPIFLCGMFVDPFLAGFVAASAALMFTRQAADWFAGREPRPVPERGGQQPKRQPDRLVNPPQLRPPSQTDTPNQVPDPFQTPAQPPSQSPVQTPHQPPAPHAGLAPWQQPADTATAPFSGQFPVQYQPPRPSHVTFAAVLTWGMSLLTLLFCALSAYLLTTADGRAEVEKAMAQNPQFQQTDITLQQMTAMMQVMLAGLALWSIVAMVLAGLVLRGLDWARILLAISAGTAGLFGLICVIAFPPALVLPLSCVGTIWLMYRSESSAWFNSRKKQPPMIRIP